MAHDRPETMLVFDLDGVVTDLETHRPDHDIVRTIGGDLTRGVPVAFITGRPLVWVEESVMPDLREICDQNALSNLIVIAEKGAVTATEERGTLRGRIDENLAVPPGFREAARGLLDKAYEGRRFGDLMFWDDTKQVMMNVQRRHGIRQSDFARAQPAFAAELRSLVKEQGLTGFKVDTTTLAVDVEHVSAGKNKGARNVLGWLEEQGSRPRSYVVFGDSASDSAIAETLGEQSRTTFVFVGDPGTFSPADEAPYKTVVTGGRYAADTKAYLEKLGLLG